MGKYLLSLQRLLLLPLLTVSLLSQGLKIYVHLFTSRLGQPIDDGIDARLYVASLHLLLLVKAHLPRSHALGLLEIGPGCVDDGEVVLLVSYVNVNSVMSVHIGLCYL